MVGSELELRSKIGFNGKCVEHLHENAMSGEKNGDVHLEGVAGGLEGFRVATVPGRQHQTPERQCDEHPISLDRVTRVGLVGAVRNPRSGRHTGDLSSLAGGIWEALAPACRRVCASVAVKPGGALVAHIHSRRSHRNTTRSDEWESQNEYIIVGGAGRPGIRKPRTE